MFILAVGIGLIFFYVVAQKTIDSSSQERMKTNVARQSEHLRTILNIHYSYLEGVAEKIAESNELMNEENKEVLTVFQKNTSLDRLALIDPEGNAYYDNGVEKNVSHRRYFKEGISGNREPFRVRFRACLKNHFRNLQAPLCGIFYPHSVAVARYAALIRIKSPTN